MKYLKMIIFPVFLFIIIYILNAYKEDFESGDGNFVASPYQWKQMEKKFKLDPIYKAIGGSDTPARSTGLSSDWGWVWRGPMVWNGWKYY